MRTRGTEDPPPSAALWQHPAPGGGTAEKVSEAVASRRSCRLGEPCRSRRVEAGQDLYATIGIARDDRVSRLRQRAKNYDLFDAPVGMFFYVDRRVGPPQRSGHADTAYPINTLRTQRASLDEFCEPAWLRRPVVLHLSREHASHDEAKRTCLCRAPGAQAPIRATCRQAEGLAVARTLRVGVA